MILKKYINNIPCMKDKMVPGYPLCLPSNGDRYLHGALDAIPDIMRSVPVLTS